MVATRAGNWCCIASLHLVVRWHARSACWLVTMSETDRNMPESVNVRNAFAKRVRVTRTKLGLSQEEFGARIGVRRQTIQQWETAKNYPQAHKLRQFEEIERGADLPVPLAVPLTPTQRVHESGSRHLRGWLWDYTLDVSQAVIEEMRLRGPAPYADDSAHPEAAAMPRSPVAPRRTARG